MITEFGRILRRHRIKRTMLLGEMAKGIGIRSAELSSYENGKQLIPMTLVWKIINFLELKHPETLQLIEADKMKASEARIEAQSIIKILDAMAETKAT